MQIELSLNTQITQLVNVKTLTEALAHKDICNQLANKLLHACSIFIVYIKVN